MQDKISQPQQALARAVAIHRRGDLAQAELLYTQLLRDRSTQFDALHMLGVIEGQRGNFPAALRRLDEALRIRPNSTEVLVNLGHMQSQMGDDAAAIATYEKALTSDPNSVLAHNNLSIALRKRGKPAAALEHCEAALKIAPDYVFAWNNRSNALFDLGRYDEALAGYDRAIALAANHAHAHLGRGNVLGRLKRHREALAAYDHALRINPNLIQAWLNRVETLAGLGRYGEALASIDRALAVQPALAEAWFTRGNVLFSLKRHAEAFASFDKALQANPDLAHADGYRLHAKQHICDWTDLEAEASALLSGLRAGRAVTTPFPLLTLPSSPADQLHCAQRYVQEQPAFAPLWRDEVYAHGRIRVAYLSADFRQHPTAYLTAGLFEQHDRSRFEIVGVSFGDNDDSAIRQRLQRAFDRFLDVRKSSDDEIAALLRRLEVDIAVDLMGFTKDARPGVLARRPVPIQVNYLGYPATMGAHYIDYILADATVIPEYDTPFYAERVVQLPGSYQVNDDKRPISGRTPTRRECRLPDDAFVFCCFNSTQKLDPGSFAIWMRLLHKVEHSVLWLLEGSATASANLRAEAERRGIAPSRLIFAGKTNLSDHLARHQQADLFLDTWPYNAHTTASDALWAGLPVLTCLGSTFAGRVAASLLRAVGVPELAVESLPDYEALALKIARDRVFCAALKDKLARNRRTFPLFDTRRFTRNIEAAYTLMWRRSQRGEPPQGFTVQPA